MKKYKITIEDKTIFLEIHDRLTPAFIRGNDETGEPTQLYPTGSVETVIYFETDEVEIVEINK